MAASISPAQPPSVSSSSSLSTLRKSVYAYSNLNSPISFPLPNSQIQTLIRSSNHRPVALQSSTAVSPPQTLKNGQSLYGIFLLTFSSLKPIHTRYNHLKKLRQQGSFRNGMCRAELSTDAPVALAIGACILNSLIFPVIPPSDDVESESPIDLTDARFAVMGIISFIPFFNWMSWVFAWMDTGKRRYAVYAIVYLAPYVRSNLSISPEESWLPVASILLCIIHVQLEASIKNGDIQGFQLFNEAAKHLSSTRKNSKTSEEREERKVFHNLPSARERNDMRDWTAPQKHREDQEILSEDEQGN